MAKVVPLRREALADKSEVRPVKLTKRVVDELAPDPAGRDRWAWDSELRGFGLRVLPSGVRSYAVQYRDQSGRTRRISLGRHGVLTPDLARKLAVQRLAEVARGENPSVERRAARTKARQTQTVRQLAERFLREHVDAKRKPRTAKHYRYVLDDHILPDLGPLAVDAVTRDDVEALHLRMRTTPTTANRALAVLSKMFNLAEAWRLRPLQSNPCYRLERYPERARDRFYGDHELKQIGAALNEAERTRTIPDGAIASLRLLALTGCRASEILELRWADVDFEAGVLRLRDAKAGARAVPLGAPAITLLQELPRHGEQVVSGRKPGSQLTLPALEAAWKKVRTAAGLTNARIHDLRHTVGTYAGQAGLNAFIVRDVLGHKGLAMTGRYVSADTAPLRRAADEVAGRVATALKVGGDNQDPGNQQRSHLQRGDVRKP
jgi:integrase